MSGTCELGLVCHLRRCSQSSVERVNLLYVFQEITSVSFAFFPAFLCSPVTISHTSFSSNSIYQIHDQFSFESLVMPYLLDVNCSDGSFDGVLSGLEHKSAHGG